MESEHVCQWKGCGKAHASLKVLVDHLHNVHIDGEQVSSPSSKQLNCLWQGCWRNKPYTARLHLIEHLRAHTGERPYKCPIKGCTKTFSIECNAITHSRTPHTNNRHKGGAKPKASKQKPPKLRKLSKPLKPLAPRAAKTVAMNATSLSRLSGRTSLPRGAKSIDVDFPLVTPHSPSSGRSSSQFTEASLGLEDLHTADPFNHNGTIYDDNLAALNASRVPRQPLIVGTQPDRLGCMMHGIPYWGVELHATSLPQLQSSINYKPYPPEVEAAMLASEAREQERIRLYDPKRVDVKSYALNRIQDIRSGLLLLSQDPCASITLQNDCQRLDNRLTTLLEG